MFNKVDGGSTTSSSTNYKTNNVGDYIFERLGKVTKTVFGVPGDFNLSLLEHMYITSSAPSTPSTSTTPSAPSTSSTPSTLSTSNSHQFKTHVKWCGNNNELNAGYCADGYARINNGFGCLITTFGVGELSAMNAIAGAYTENVGVLHIVGMSPTFMHGDTNDTNDTDDTNDINGVESEYLFKSLHHLLPNKKTYLKQNHMVYTEMVKSLSCCTEILSRDDLTSMSESTSTSSHSKMTKVQQKIDNVIEQIIHQMKPGYLFIPCDIPDMEFAQNLDKQLNINTNTTSPTNPFYKPVSSVETEIVQFLLNETYSATNPGFISDYFMKNDKLTVCQLLQNTNWYCYSTPGSRGATIDESLQNFQGVFCNESSTLNTLSIMDTNDFIMHWGANINEMNFKVRSNCNENWLANLNIVYLGKDYVQIGYNNDTTKSKKHKFKLYTDNVNCSRIFNEYVKSLDFKKLAKIQTRSQMAAESSNGKEVLLPQWSDSYDIDISSKTNNKITQQGFSKKLSTNGVLQKGDIIINELSSFLFEMENVRIPELSRTVNQMFYASIGYALPCTLGVCMALKDLEIADKHRVILLQGDGSAQMTMQELGCFLTYDVSPTIFMFNNSGYTIEREIMGRFKSYNDILCNWDWCNMFKTFGDKNEEKHVARRITNYKELNEFHENVMNNKEFGGKIKMAELILDQNDVCNSLKNFVTKNTKRP